MNERELEQLGIFRIPLPIPFPQAGGPVNAYIFEEERGFLLFDPGLGTEASKAALAEGFARTGHRFEDVNRIVLSHGHIDHFGAAAWVLERAGKSVPVLIHSADADKVLESGPDWPTLLMRNAGFFAKLGMPMPLLEETAADLGRNAGLGMRLAEVTPLIPGNNFRCRDLNLEVMHMPGHTRGVSCLYERGHRLLFSADHLLERVSPNPLLDLGVEGKPPSFKSLISYFDSVRRVCELDIELVLPGHGAPFSNHLQVIESLYGFYQRRQERILEILDAGPLTVYEVRRELFPPADGFEVILMISETLGNLEMLEQRGEIQRLGEGEYLRFRTT